MTARQLKRRIDYWLKVMEPLGIGHWDFEVCVVDDIEHHPNAQATVDASEQYDNARITFCTEAVNLDEHLLSAVDQIIIHELLHVVLRDYDEIVDEAAWQMAPPARSLWQNVVEREKEGVIERLARTIWTIHSG